MTERAHRIRLIMDDRLGVFPDPARTMRVDATLPSGDTLVLHVSVWWKVKRRAQSSSGRTPDS